MLPYMLYSYFKLSYKSDTGDVTLGIYKKHLSDFFRHKAVRFVILSYFAAFVFFYIFKAVDYFSNDRAYPQAKAYKIVADLVLFDFDFFIANRNLYYKPSGVKYINTYHKIQSYLMKKGFEYIPKDDAERAIWKYEYYYSQYIRAMAAPIDFDKLHEDDLGYILRIGGHPTIYKPQAKQMLKEVEHLLDMLMNNPMKDKRYDMVERYTTNILFSEWWQKFSFLHYTLGVRTVDEESSKEYRETIEQWTDDPKYLKRLSMLSNWLDVTKEKIDSSKALQQEMRRHKLLYPDLMGLRVYFRARLAYADLLHKPFSCELDSLQKYYKTRKEFINYATHNMSFKRFSWKERLIADNSVNGDPNAILEHVLYRQCNIEKANLTYSHGFMEEKILTKEDWAIDKKILKGFKNGR